jgi:hypothetical protein
MIFMRILITLITCLYSFVGYAQTKLISFRSHSGSNAHFRTAVEKDIFDIGGSNFGIVEREKIDSVVMKSNNRIIVSRRFYGSARGYQRDTLTNVNAKEFFDATSMHELQFALRSKYKKANVDNTHYVGFNNRFKPSTTPKKR